MIRILLVVLSLGCLAACQQEEQMNFKGESDHWKVEFTVNNAAKDQIQQSIKIIYKKSDSSSVGEFEYSVKTNLGKWGQGIIELDEDGTYTSSSIASFNNLELTDKENPEFSIKWNDTEEEILLEVD